MSLAIEITNKQAEITNFATRPNSNEATLKYRDKRGNLHFYPAAEVTQIGTRRAIGFIEKSVQKRNTHFDEDYVNSIHKRLMYFAPWLGGVYRPEGSDYRSGYVELENGQLVQRLIPLTPGGANLDRRMKIFGDWMHTEVERIKDIPEDLVSALHVACEAHTLLISPELHPYADANGRDSRLLLNSILMLNTHELMFYGEKILPVPLLRSYDQDKPKDLSTWKEDPYLKISREAFTTRNLTGLEVFVAQKWSANMEKVIAEATRASENKNRKKYADTKLVDVFLNRKQTIDKFIQDYTENYQVRPNANIPLPNLFSQNEAA